MRRYIAGGCLMGFGGVLAGGSRKTVLCSQNLSRAFSARMRLVATGWRLGLKIAGHREVGECIGIGVSVSGLVVGGKLKFSPTLGWRDVDLKGPLEAATGLPVSVENAANACEWRPNGNCWVEFGTGCYVEGGNPDAPHMWFVVGSYGVVCTILMIVYDRFIAPKRAAA